MNGRNRSADVSGGPAVPIGRDSVARIARPAGRRGIPRGRQRG